MASSSGSSEAAVLYHCPCEPLPATSTPSFAAQHALHSLHSLYFCEECDSVKCSACIVQEIASYYCPNCLFEVPSASVRAEKNRCARNCFLCPCCDNTLALVATDPDPAASGPPEAPQASVGEPPYYLACSACRWDSKSTTGIAFDKPTGLASQLQKSEDSKPQLHAFDLLREHLEPYVRAGSNSTAHGPPLAALAPSSSGSSAVAAAARALTHSSSTLGRDIPSNIASAARFNSLQRLALAAASGSSHSIARGPLAGADSLRRAGLRPIPASAHAAALHRDELKPFRWQEARDRKGKGSQADRAPSRMQTDSAVLRAELQRVQVVRQARSVDPLSPLEARWTYAYDAPYSTNELRPLRMPLHAKRIKRCNKCRHIIVKPETKAASTRYKIRLVASNYLLAINVQRRLPPSIGSRLSAVGAAASQVSTGVSSRTSVRSRASLANLQTMDGIIDIGSAQDRAEPLRPGRQHEFHVTFTNPLYEKIQVYVEVDAEPKSPGSAIAAIPEGKAGQGSAESNEGSGDVKQYTTSLACERFEIGPFTEVWEREYTEDPEGDDRRNGGRLPAGILAKKGNKTVVQLDLTTARGAAGPIVIYLLVTYTYKAEESGMPVQQREEKSETAASSSSGQAPVAAAGTTAESRSNQLEAAKPGMDQDADVPTGLKSFKFWSRLTLGNVVPRTPLGYAVQPTPPAHEKSPP